MDGVNEKCHRKLWPRMPQRLATDGILADESFQTGTMVSKPLKTVGGFGTGSAHRPRMRDAVLMGGERLAKLPPSLKEAPQASRYANPPALSERCGVALSEKALCILGQGEAWKSEWKGAG
jgi:hypothetical protein